MAVTDQILVGGNSMFGIGLQAGKGAPRSTNSLFRWFSYTGLQYGLNQQIQNLPPEGGKSITPRGAYKSSAYGAGQFSLVPRLISDFATILLAAMGSAPLTTVAHITKLTQKCLSRTLNLSCTILETRRLQHESGLRVCAAPLGEL